MGIEEWIARRKKKNGQIRNIGFSFHGTSDAFIELVDAFPWDFCQIQYNYMDETSQGAFGASIRGRQGLPGFIMEPLRGGRLAGGLPS